MAIAQARPGEVIDLRPAGTPPDEVQLAALVKTPALEVKRLTLPKGRAIPTHRAPGEITVHCLEGRVAFTAGDATHTLEPGRMLFLEPGTPHSLVGLEDSALLVTKLIPERPAVMAKPALG